MSTLMIYEWSESCLYEQLQGMAENVSRKYLIIGSCFLETVILKYEIN